MSVSTSPPAKTRTAFGRRQLLLGSVAAALTGRTLRAVADDGPPFSPAVQASLERAMREAIAEALPARYHFGAVLLDAVTGETLFRARNSTQDGDPSAHAEINAMRGAGLAGIDLSRTVLVTTAESCPMCASCAVWAGVKGVAFGTSIATLIRFGWEQIDIAQREVVARATFNRMPVVGGVLADETDLLYRDGPPR